MNKEKIKPQLKTERQKSNSVGSLDEYIKRRRPQEGECSSEIFKRSKRIDRTPPKERQNIETEVVEMEEVRKFMENLNTNLTEMRNDNSETKMEIRENFKKIQEQMESLAKELKIAKDELSQAKTEWKQDKILNDEKMGELENKLKAVEYKLEQQEREKRRNKLVISGLKFEGEDVNTMKDKMEKFIKENLQVEVKITAAYKIGEKKNVIEVEDLGKKLEILKNKSKLRHSKSEKVYIDNDLTIMERKIQAIIRERAEEMRKSGKIVKMGYQKLICEDKMWRWANVEGCLREIPKN